ncbi:hypothetical protein ACROYT_G027912 [Oculina patagonica]
MGVVIILYHKVFRAIRHQRLKSSTQRRVSTSVEEIRLAKLLFTVSLGFCLCWGPVMAVECIRFIGVWTVPRQVYLISTYFGATSSAINVFIYGVMNKAFRVEFVKILCCNRIGDDDDDDDDDVVEHRMKALDSLNENSCRLKPWAGLLRGILGNVCMVRAFL